jgi:chorismate mutase
MNLKYYIVEGSVLPDVFKKVVEVKRLLETDMKLSINSACQQVDISRSTYYKYKDSVYEFYENKRIRIVTFSINLLDEPGLLSNVLEIIADSKANILTINQNIPMNGVAIVVISVETIKMESSMEELLNSLRGLSGVKKVDILSRS